MSQFSSYHTDILKQADFTRMLLAQNGWENGRLREWFFLPGMLFQSMDKWWGNRGKRKIPHEGLDLCLYTDETGQARTLGDAVKIPAMSDGKIVKIMNDFLGESIFMEHAINGKSAGILTIYGHADPLKKIGVGQSIKKGDAVCFISHPAKRKKTILPHLHITVGLFSSGISYESLDWSNIPHTLSLLNPVDALCRPVVVGDLEIGTMVAG